MGLFDRNETVLQKYIALLKKRSKEENNRNINEALEYLKDVESNKKETSETIEQLTSQGYVPCERCNP